MSLNRIVALAAAACGLAGAIAVPLANLDTSSTVGVIGGLSVIAGIAAKWLDGWQKHEEREYFGAPPEIPDTAADPEEEGDGTEDPATVNLQVGDYSNLPDDKGDQKAARKHA